MTRPWLMILACLAAAAFGAGDSRIDEHFYLEKLSRQLPVRVRGNLANGIIILFVQGGPASNALYFARIDYTGWRGTLETFAAVAYYDFRGLNMRPSQIDSSMITFRQFSRDIMAIAAELNRRYNADIYIMGHSYGGYHAYHCLANNAADTIFTGAIIISTPVTTDYDQRRYTKIRPQYLRELATEFIELGRNTAFWRDVLVWMNETDSIYSAETSRRWNSYVDRAFTPSRRRIMPWRALQAAFGWPYNPIKLLRHRDNDLVGDFIWADLENQDFTQLLPMIKVPVLAIAGRYDDIASPNEQALADSLIPNCTVRIIPDCGHEPFLDQPDIFAKAISEFITIHSP